MLLGVFRMNFDSEKISEYKKQAKIYFYILQIIFFLVATIVTLISTNINILVLVFSVIFIIEIFNRNIIIINKIRNKVVIDVKHNK